MMDVCVFFISLSKGKKLYFVYAHNIDLYSLLICYSYDKMTNYEAIQLGFLQSFVPLFFVFNLRFNIPHILNGFLIFRGPFFGHFLGSFFGHFLVVWSERAHVPRQW